MRKNFRPLFAALYLPDVALQAALRHEPELYEKPVALLETDEKKATICQFTKSAAEAGISKGMSPSQALARCLSVIIKGRAREQEKIAGDILLHYAAKLSPEIEATGPGVCTVRFSAERNWLASVDDVVSQLATLHLRAQAGIAPAPDLSFLAACLARPVLQIDEPEKFLAPLPIETLLTINQPFL